MSYIDRISSLMGTRKSGMVALLSDGTAVVWLQPLHTIFARCDCEDSYRECDSVAEAERFMSHDDSACNPSRTRSVAASMRFAKSFRIPLRTKRLGRPSLWSLWCLSFRRAVPVSCTPNAWRMRHFLQGADYFTPNKGTRTATTGCGTRIRFLSHRPPDNYRGHRQSGQMSCLRRPLQRDTCH